MTVFYSTLILTFILALFSRKIEEGRYKNIAQIFILIIGFIFISVAGFRLNIGDTYFYKHSYENFYQYNLSEFTIKQGFDIFQYFLYQMSPDPQFMIFITSLVTQSAIIYTFYKYRSYFELEIYMYITCGLFLVTMNGLRQAFVGALLFLATKLIVKRRFITYLIVVCILSTMHSTALIMIPIYFIAIREAWSKSTLVIILISMLGFIFFNELMPTFFDILGEESKYAVYEDTMSQKGQGSSLMRVLVNAVPVILAYCNRKRLKENWNDSNVFVNISIINLIFITFALYNWIFARFQLYFQFYNIVLLPYVIKTCFDRKEERNLIYYLFLICYFIFFYYEQVIGGIGLGYKSNYINF